MKGESEGFLEFQLFLLFSSMLANHFLALPYLKLGFLSLHFIRMLYFNELKYYSAKRTFVEHLYITV